MSDVEKVFDNFEVPEIHDSLEENLHEIKKLHTATGQRRAGVMEPEWLRWLFAHAPELYEHACAELRHTASVHKAEAERLKERLKGAGICPVCLEEYEHEFTEPFAYCGCSGAIEWTCDLPLLSSLRHQLAQLRAAGDAMCAEWSQKDTEHTGLVTTHKYPSQVAWLALTQPEDKCGQQQDGAQYPPPCPDCGEETVLNDEKTLWVCKCVHGWEMDAKPTTQYSVREMLETLDPPAVILRGRGDYLERPPNGWQLCKNDFIGIGYHGNEGGSYDDPWEPAEAGLGHIPSKGYG